MDGLIPILITLIKDAPGYFAITVGFVFVIFALYLKVRSVSIEEITSIGKMQSVQVGELIKQITQLSKDLAEARVEISKLYAKIDELEDLVRVYKNKLKDVSEEESHSASHEEK